MAFNRALDKELFSAEIGDNGLKVGIFSYNGGDKKFQIGPPYLHQERRYHWV